MDAVLQELSKLSPASIAALATVLAALATATGALAAAVVTGILGKIIVSPFLSARDQQDKEAEWRKHALELTKLDLDRKLKTRAATDKSRIRPSILDFLANYRDLQELGTKSPKDLYTDISEKRISKMLGSPSAKSPRPTPVVGPNALLLSGTVLLLFMTAVLRPRHLTTNK